MELNLKEDSSLTVKIGTLDCWQDVPLTPASVLTLG